MKVSIAAVGVLAAVSSLGATPAGDALDLKIGQTEFLTIEPILARVHLESSTLQGLPAAPGTSLRFEIEPAVKPRKGARPLPLESQAGETAVSTRDYDLFEWFEISKAGTWTVKAVFEREGRKLASPAVTFTVAPPAKGDAEAPAVGRIHHPPWTNYEADKFCGDTFDLVQKWPASRLVKYCEYWNGRYSQNKKDYEAAIKSYRAVVEKHPGFALADDAEYGIVECLYLQKKLEEARAACAALLKKCGDNCCETTAVGVLAGELAAKIGKELGAR